MAALGPALPLIPTVLVLCQRSLSSTDETVVQTVRGLLNFIEDGLGGLGVGREFRIRFCTPCIIEKNESNSKKRKLELPCDNSVHDDPAGGDYADYNLKLDMSTLDKIKQLMNRENPPIESFKYVILHTCPFAFMEFEAISAIMEPGDIMIMTRSRDGDGGGGGANEIVLVTQEMIYRHLVYTDELDSRIHMYFDDTDKPGVYNKKDDLVVIQPSNKKSRTARRGGKKRRKNKNTLRYKPKKSCSYRNRRYHRTKRSGSKKLK